MKDGRMPPGRWSVLKDRISIVALILFPISFLFLLLAGMSLVSDYYRTGAYTYGTVWRAMLLFVAPVLSILIVHDLGHLIVARRYRMRLGLPIYIPGPTLIGTLGTVTLFKQPVPSRRALIDVAAAGPIVGFIAAVLITILGIQLSIWRPQPIGDDVSVLVLLNTPLVYQSIAHLMPVLGDTAIHPVAFAGWVGFVLTFVHLLPVVPLDGGYIAYGFLKKRAKMFGYVILGGLILLTLALGLIGWIWLYVILMVINVLTKPIAISNPASMVHRRSWSPAVAAVCIVVVSFVPALAHEVDRETEMSVWLGPFDINVAPDSWENVTLSFNNTGETLVRVYVTKPYYFGWIIRFDEQLQWNDDTPSLGTLLVHKVPHGSSITRLNVSVQPWGDVELGHRDTLTIKLAYRDDGVLKELSPRFTATVGWIAPRDVQQNAYLPLNTTMDLKMSYQNRIHDVNGTPARYTIGLELPAGILGVLTDASVDGLAPTDFPGVGPLGEIALHDNETAILKLWLHAPPGTKLEKGCQANVMFGLAGSDMVIRMPVSFDVVDLVFKVSIVPLHDSYALEQGHAGNVSFALESKSTVEVTARLAYEIDTVNFTILSKHDELVLPAGQQYDEVVIILALGDVGSRSDLIITVDYGTDWQYHANATIPLAIT